MTQPEIGYCILTCFRLKCNGVIVMYQSLYHIMFNAVTDALSAMQNQNYGIAAEILIRAQIRAEETYLSAQESNEAEPQEKQAGDS